MASENRSTTRDVVFLLAGAAVGATLGILLAPKAGKETRDQLTDWLKDRREKGNFLLGRLKENMPAKKRIVAAFQAGKEAYYDNQPNSKETVGS